MIKIIGYTTDNADVDVLLILHFRNINKRRLSSTFNIKKN
jgi:hypothetical protein